MTPDLEQRIRGGIWGLLVGDALGVPYEFHPAEEIPPYNAIEFMPPSGFARAHAGTAPGTWSDDGAQALCLLDSLLQCDRLDPEDLMQRLFDWYESGYLAVGGVVFDVGVQTGQAFAAFRSGTAAVDCGGALPEGKGNGSLMRALPLAIWHQGSDEELVRDAFLQSSVTHGHLRVRLCCALYCLWARAVLRDAAEPWLQAIESIRRIFPAASPEREEFEAHIRPEAEASCSGGGYVVDSLRSARLVCQQETYEAVVRQAIRLGNDTDTSACIAGGVAGLQFGIDAIPAHWRAKLRGQELFAELLEKLVDRCCID
ncbi:ADP-ribosylglycohydrolase family protein [Pelagibius sp. Alg239-R121]|uniref:ADP-ribosylglycohydrolase family protein n=1 Tax=Pelagibius sp. Alg239-R121 TaxID=2993448 RepID=UPI0024A6B356|nr:ADP-ribosylglycohydrolase family protein [Pelagibius sp. Alg239-R121]